MELAGRVVVVPVDWAGAEGLATRLAAGGATVVLLGPDAAAAGELAGKLEGHGAGRPAVFLTDGSPASLEALASFVSELFPTS